MLPRFLLKPLLTAALAFMPQISMAQDAGFSLELNTARQTEKGCELVILVRNGSDKTLDRGVWNLAFFDPDNKFSRILAMELNNIRSNTAHAKVFALRGTECSGISWILINDAPVCSVAGVEGTDTLCLQDMRAKSVDGAIRFGTS